MKRPRTLPTVEKFIENLVISIGRKVEKLITEAEGRMDEMTPEQRKRVAERRRVAGDKRNVGVIDRPYSRAAGRASNDVQFREKEVNIS